MEQTSAKYTFCCFCEYRDQSSEVINLSFNVSWGSVLYTAQTEINSSEFFFYIFKITRIILKNNTLCVEINRKVHVTFLNFERLYFSGDERFPVPQLT